MRTTCLLVVVAACNQPLPTPEGIAGEEGQLHFVGCDPFPGGGCESPRPARLWLMPRGAESVRLVERDGLPPVIYGIAGDPRVCRVESWVGPCCVPGRSGCSFTDMPVTSFDAPACSAA